MGRLGTSGNGSVRDQVEGRTEGEKTGIGEEHLGDDEET